MFRQMHRLSRFLLVSRRNRSVRAGLLFVAKNFFLLTSVLLCIEVLLLALGVNGICLPMTRQMREVVARLVL